MQKVKRVLIFAYHNNGCNILKYLLKRKDVKIVKVVTYKDQPGQWWNSVKELLEKKSLPYELYTDRNQLYESVQDLDVDLLLSISWRHVVEKRILNIPKIGSVNFHNSLLPKHRGVYANSWPIFKGEKVTGVSLHWMTPQLDNGKVISQEKISIESWETAREVWENLNKAYLRLFKKMWPKVDDWEKISKHQRGSANYNSLEDYKTNNQIDLNKSIKTINFINFLRAKSFDPYYKSAFFIDPKTKKKVFVSINLTVQK